MSRPLQFADSNIGAFTPYRVRGPVDPAFTNSLIRRHAQTPSDTGAPFGPSRQMATGRAGPEPANTPVNLTLSIDYKRGLDETMKGMVFRTPWMMDRDPKDITSFMDTSIIAPVSVPMLNRRLFTESELLEDYGKQAHCKSLLERFAFIGACLENPQEGRSAAYRPTAFALSVYKTAELAVPPNVAQCSGFYLLLKRYKYTDTIASLMPKTHAAVQSAKKPEEKEKYYWRYEPYFSTDGGKPSRFEYENEHGCGSYIYVGMIIDYEGPLNHINRDEQAAAFRQLYDPLTDPSKYPFLLAKCNTAKVQIRV